MPLDQPAEAQTSVGRELFILHWVVATGDVRLGGETESLVALVVDVERSVQAQVYSTDFAWRF